MKPGVDAASTPNRKEQHLNKDLKDLFYFTITQRQNSSRTWEMQWGDTLYMMIERSIYSPRRRPPTYSIIALRPDSAEPDSFAQTNSWQNAMKALEEDIIARAEENGTDPELGASSVRRFGDPPRRLNFRTTGQTPCKTTYGAESDDGDFAIVSGPAPGLNAEGSYYRVYRDNRQIAFTDSWEAAVAAANAAP